MWIGNETFRRYLYQKGHFDVEPISHLRLLVYELSIECAKLSKGGVD